MKRGRGAFAGRTCRTARCRRRWTTRAATAPTASPSSRAAPASARTPSRPTVPTPSTASTSATTRTPRPASSLAPPPSSPPTQVKSSFLSLPLSLYMQKKVQKNEFDDILFLGSDLFFFYLIVLVSCVFCSLDAGSNGCMYPASAR